MLETILKNVTEAEEKADQIRLEAEKEAANILDEARRKAEEMKTEAVQSGRVREKDFLAWVYDMRVRRRPRKRRKHLEHPLSLERKKQWMQ